MQDAAEDDLEEVTLVLRHVPHPASFLQAQAADVGKVHRDFGPRQLPENTGGNFTAKCTLSSRKQLSNWVGTRRGEVGQVGIVFSCGSFCGEQCVTFRLSMDYLGTFLMNRLLLLDFGFQKNRKSNEEKCELVTLFSIFNNRMCQLTADDIWDTDRVARSG